MNDHSNTPAASGTGSILIGFAIGAAVGAGLALLLAPDSGRHTRQRLASTARRWTREAEHTFDEARHTVADLGSDAKSALRAGQEAFLRDRATREPRTERLYSRAGDTAKSSNAEPSNEEAAR